MIKEKIHEEMILQNISQAELVRLSNRFNKNKILTSSQVSNFLSGKKLLSIYHIESIFEVLNIKLVRIL
jgi:transcriptional regulator with XRE-family HTH domain